MFWENSPIHGLNTEASTNFWFTYFIDQFCFWESQETRKIQTIQKEFCHAISVKRLQSFSHLLNYCFLANKSKNEVIKKWCLQKTVEEKDNFPKFSPRQNESPETI